MIKTKDHGGRLEECADLFADSKAQLLNAVMRNHGTHAAATGQGQSDLRIDRTIVNARDFTPQMVTRRRSHRAVVEQQDRRGLDQRGNLHADGQAHGFSRIAGDHRNDFVFIVQLEAYLEIDIALTQADDMARKLVA